MEKEWEKFRDIVMECTNEVCGMRHGLRRKGSEWWNEEVSGAVAEKRRAFEEWLQRSDRLINDRYRAKRVVVKRAVKVAKWMADWRWGERLGNDFEGNKKMFWKEVKRVSKGEQARDEMVKDVNGQILRNGVEVRRRLVQYFEQVLNMADAREANINEVGNWWMPVLGDLNEKENLFEEVRETVNEMKSGKAPGLDGFPVECLKKGRRVVLEWLVRLLNLSFDMGVVPMDWRGACIVPLYKSKGDKCECSNSRGISLLSVVGKLYGRVLIKRVRAATECAIGEEQCGFRHGRGCMAHVFAVKQVCE